MGQFMSIQGSHIIVTHFGGYRLIYSLDAKTLPPQLESIFSELQRTADYMPDWQSEQVLVRSLGPDWRLPLSRFDVTPIAAASIGQVHSAQVSNGNLEVAMKIQFPGVAQSISSDLGNLKMLLSASAVLPKGLYLDNTIKIMKRELLDECDYAREAESCKRFQTLLADDPVFRVPRVIENLTSAHVLTTERMFGTSLSRSKHFSRQERDLVGAWVIFSMSAYRSIQIGSNILRLCLQEIFTFMFMQTDPNWSNFLWNAQTKQVPIIPTQSSLL